MMDLTAYLLHEENKPSDEEILDQIEDRLAEEAPPSFIDEMEQKIASAYQAGIRLAREQGMQELDEVVEKNAFMLLDDVVGGVVGHHYGKRQAERGEAYRFGGKQLASALLIPGGAGYQIGRGIAHSNARADKAEAEKTARIFGEHVPHTIDHASIPYEHRREDYHDYLKTKSQEKPSGYLRGIGGGALIGGGTGALLGALSAVHAPGHGAGVGGLIGAGIGGLGGAIAAHSDKSKIDNAQKVLKDGKIDKDLARQIAFNHDARRADDYWTNERRHWETLGALEKRAETEKRALLPLIAGAAARMIGGQVAKQGIKSVVGGMAKDVGKNLIVNKATDVASGALNRARQPAQQMTPQVAQAAPAIGGFKYADGSGAIGKFIGGLGGKGPGTFGQKLVGGMVRNPGAALVGAGMVGGALMAPRDPVTGEKQYLRGAATGAALGGGAYALGAGNALRSATMRNKNPLLGAGVRDYARSSVQATGNQAQRAFRASQGAAQQAAGAAPVAAAASHVPAPAASPQQAPSSVQVDPRLAQEHSKILARRAQIRNQGAGGGGSISSRGMLGGTNELTVPGGHGISGEMTAKFAALAKKYANRQTLSYNPATKSFTRTHLTPDTTMGTDAGNVIPAGHTEAVGGHVAEPPRGPAPAGLPASKGPSQTFSLHGGNVMSSSPAPGVAARPQVAARPMAAPPPIPAAAMVRKSPIAAGAQAALRAAPKPPALPSLAGARSLVR